MTNDNQPLIKHRIFLIDVEDGVGCLIGGDLPSELPKPGILEMLHCELVELQDGESTTITITRQDMTDEEIENAPDM